MLKFDYFRSQGIDINETQVLDVVRAPDTVVDGYAGRKIAQAGLDVDRVLRVVYEESDGEQIIVTFYPGRRSRYE